VLAMLIQFPAQASGQWKLDSRVPDGYTVVAQGEKRLVFRRRLPGRGTNTIRVSLTQPRDPEIAIASYLKGMQLPGDILLDGSYKPTRIADRQGHHIEFSGPSRLKGRTGRVRRTILGTRLDGETLLIARSDTMYTVDPLDPEADRIVRAAMDAVLDTLKVAGPGGDAVKDPRPPVVADPKPRKDDPLASNLLEYQDTTIVPFSFRYPASWEVFDDAGLVPGNLFVLASTISGVGGDETQDVSLRVRVVGFIPELLASTDSLARATEMVRLDLLERLGPCRVNDIGSYLAGSARGTLLEYRAEKETTDGDRGVIMVTTAHGSLLLANASLPATADTESRRVAMDILSSFKLNVDGGMKKVDSDVATFEYPPNWKLTQYDAQGNDRAFGVKSPAGIELVIHSTMLPGNTVPDEGESRRIAIRHLVKDLKLANAEIVKNSTLTRVTHKASGLRLNLLNEDSTTDVCWFERGGSFHFAFLTLPGGVESLDYGRALSVISSLSGPGTARNPHPLHSAGRFFSVRLEFRHSGLDIYDDNGILRGASSSRLELLADGTARRWRHAAGRTRMELGVYTRVDGGIRLAFEGTKPTMWTLDVTGRSLAEAGSKRRWYMIP